MTKSLDRVKFLELHTKIGLIDITDTTGITLDYFLTVSVVQRTNAIWRRSPGHR
jgi:hypothetical protein